MSRRTETAYKDESPGKSGSLSPLLANIILDDLDKELEKRSHRFVRYADDFLVLVKSWQTGEQVMESLKR